MLSNDGEFATRSDLAREYQARLQIADTWMRAGQLGAEGTPGEMIAWLQRAQLSYPEALQDAVDQIGHQVWDWKVAHDALEEKNTHLLKRNQQLEDAVEQANQIFAATINQQRQSIATLERELADANASLQVIKPHSAPKDERENSEQEAALDPRERSTLYKIILAIAKEKYRFVPGSKQSSAPQNIASTSEREGLSVSHKTVRRHLNAAVQLLQD